MSSAKMLDEMSIAKDFFELLQNGVIGFLSVTFPMGFLSNGGISAKDIEALPLPMRPGLGSLRH